MAEQRQFRFRLPWLSAATTLPRPVPEPEAPRPTPVQIRASPQPTATISTPRPPFRPAGIAPPPQPSAPQAQRPSPPRHTTTESQPASPVTTQQRSSSIPPTPSRSAAPESMVASLPSLPSLGPPQSRAASVPPSPSQTETRTQLPEPAARTASQPPSPSRLVRIQPAIAPPPPLSPLKKPQLPISVEEPKPTEPRSREEIAATRADDRETESQQKATSVVEKPEPEAPLARFSPFSRASVQREQNIRPEGGNAAPSAKDNSLRNRVAAFLSSAANATQARDPVKQEGEEEKEEIRERKKTVTGFTPSEEKVKGVSSSQSRIRKTASANGEEQFPLHKEIKEDISKLVQKLGMGHIKHPMRGEQRSVSSVTLTGENRGATMLLGGDPERKDSSLHIHRGYKKNPEDSIESTTGGQGVQKMKDSENPAVKDEHQPSQTAYINSNTQSINNSILLDSMVKERDPGVHFSLTHGNQRELGRSAIVEEPQTHRAEFNLKPSEKLTYEPRLRRRCLRGLFMETSDSEPDNPDKPRRHGCRVYGCGQISKDKDVRVL